MNIRFQLWIKLILLQQFFYQIRQLQHSQQNSWLSYWWWRALFETFFATRDLRNDIVKIKSRRLVLCQKKGLELWVTFGVRKLGLWHLCTYRFQTIELIFNFDDVLMKLKLKLTQTWIYIFPLLSADAFLSVWVDQLVQYDLSYKNSGSTLSRHSAT